jgi:hypothetical protein
MRRAWVDAPTRELRLRTRATPHHNATWCLQALQGSALAGQAVQPQAGGESAPTQPPPAAAATPTAGQGAAAAAAGSSSSASGSASGGASGRPGAAAKPKKQRQQQQQPLELGFRTREPRADARIVFVKGLPGDVTPAALTEAVK